jgi:hypothetical protein
MYKQLFSVGRHMARTLPTQAIGYHKESGWTITGETHNDYYSWVNYFEATHPKYGWVRGDFEREVIAESENGFNHFIKFHQPEEWDYWDI